MTILSYQAIRLARSPRGTFLVTPMENRTVHPETGMTYGLSACGYDIRLKQEITITKGQFKLVSSIEKFDIPNDICGFVTDKSSLARRGIAVQNTVIEPGWRGFLTLELSHHGIKSVYLPAGAPIAQVIFHLLDQPTEKPYTGRYQDQADMPVESIAQIAEPKQIDLEDAIAAITDENRHAEVPVAPVSLADKITGRKKFPL